MIVELAEYERAPGQVTGSPELLAQSLFGSPPHAEALIAELLKPGGGEREAAGFAVFHGTFSTWECRPGIWLEDLYVSAQHRRSGVGGSLFEKIARIAIQRGCTRLEWAALHWNAPALDFYAKLGARRLDEWHMHRLDREALARLAAQSSEGAA